MFGRGCSAECKRRATPAIAASESTCGTRRGGDGRGHAILGGSGTAGVVAGAKHRLVLAISATSSSAMVIPGDYNLGTERDASFGGGNGAFTARSAQRK